MLRRPWPARVGRMCQLFTFLIYAEGVGIVSRACTRQENTPTLANNPGLKKDFIANLIYVYMYISVYMHMCMGAYRGQKRALSVLDLELQVVLSPLTWLLGTELGSSTGAKPSSPVRPLPPFL